MLYTFQSGRTPPDPALLAQEDQRVVEARGGVPGQSVQLHAVPAHDPDPAQLVHQPGIAGDRCAAAHLRTGHLLRRGTALGDRHPGGQDAPEDDQLERGLLLDLDGRPDALRLRILAARSPQEQVQAQEGGVSWSGDQIGREYIYIYLYVCAIPQTETKTTREIINCNL